MLNKLRTHHDIWVDEEG